MLRYFHRKNDFMMVKESEYELHLLILSSYYDSEIYYKFEN